jgi:hypothetical protein
MRVENMNTIASQVPEVVNEKITKMENIMEKVNKLWEKLPEGELKERVKGDFSIINYPDLMGEVLSELSEEDGKLYESYLNDIQDVQSEINDVNSKE